jgi:battenin
VHKQLVYQMAVFFSRSWILIGLPPIQKLLGFPAIIQAIILIILAFESTVGIFSDGRNGTKIALVFVLISIKGICGGSA